MERWNNLWQRIDDVASAISRSSATIIGSVPLREQVREVVQKYFRELRPHLIEIGIEDTTVNGLDEPFQVLLRLANGRNRRSTYKKYLGIIRGTKTKLEIERERQIGAQKLPSENLRSLSTAETKILTTLRSLVPTAALSYEQAIIDLNGDLRLSYRGAAGELREALRETLDHLAPDADVQKEAGFKLEEGMKKPTMKQKARFILKSRGKGKTAISSPQHTIERIEESTASLARSVYDRGSLNTHVATTKEEVSNLKSYIDSILGELLQIHGGST